MVKLTRVDGDVVYINPNLLIYFQTSGNGKGGTYLRFTDNETVNVQETISYVAACCSGYVDSCGPR